MTKVTGQKWFCDQSDTLKMLRFLTLTLLAASPLPTDTATSFKLGESIEGTYDVTGGGCIFWFFGCRAYSNNYNLFVDFTVSEAISSGWTATFIFCSGASDWEEIQVSYKRIIWFLIICDLMIQFIKSLSPTTHQMCINKLSKTTWNIFNILKAKRLSL